VQQSKTITGTQLQKNLKSINQKSHVINKKNTVEWKTISSIKRKLTANKLTIAKADKQKIKTFIQENNFGTINSNPTQQYQK
jgi:hypothetical protein